MSRASSNPSARRLLLHAWLLTAALTVSSSARAQVPQTEQASSLTMRGRVLVGGALSGYWSDEPSGPTWSQWSRWELQIAPTLTYFVLDNFGVGMSLGGSLQALERPSWDERVKSLHTGAHALGALSLTARLQFVPRLGAAWMRTWNELFYERAPHELDLSSWEYLDVAQERRMARYRYNADFVRIEVFLPIVFSLTEDLGLGLGPMAWVDVYLSRDPSPEQYVPRGKQGHFDPEQSARFQVGASTWLVLSL